MTAYIYPEDFGAVGDPGTDDAAALNAANAAAKLLRKPLYFSKFYWTGSVINQDGAAWRGLNSTTSGLKAFGSGEVTPLVRNTNSVPDIVGLGFYGNGNNAAGNVVAGAIDVLIDNSATVDLRGFCIENCHFENFAHCVWNKVWVTSDAVNIDGLRLVGNTYKSLSGNLRYNNDIGGTCCMWFFRGNESDPTPPSSTVDIKGLIRSATIDDQWMDGTFVKCGYQVFGACRDFRITTKRMTGFGKNALNNTGGYAILVYSSRYLTVSDGDVRYNNDNIWVDGVHFEEPRDCAVYAASCDNIRVTHCIIKKQLCDSDVTLPRGAIALNGPGGLSVISNNRMDECKFGISVGSLTAHAVVTVNSNQIYNYTVSGITGIKLRGSALYGGSSNDISLIDNDVRVLVGTYGIHVLCSPTAPLGLLTMRGNRARANAASFYGSTAPVSILRSEFNYF